jgi:hypothetical protein
VVCSALWPFLCGALPFHDRLGSIVACVRLCPAVQLSHDHEWMVVCFQLALVQAHHVFLAFMSASPRSHQPASRRCRAGRRWDSAAARRGFISPGLAVVGHFKALPRSERNIEKVSVPAERWPTSQVLQFFLAGDEAAWLHGTSPSRSPTRRSASRMRVRSWNRIHSLLFCHLSNHSFLLYSVGHKIWCSGWDAQRMHDKMSLKAGTAQSSLLPLYANRRLMSFSTSWLGLNRLGKS